MVMEGIMPEVHYQYHVIAHNTARHFKHMGYKNVTVYTVMKKKSHGAPRKLSIAQRNEGEKNDLKAHILITAIEGPWATFHRCKFSHHEVDFFGCMCSKWMYSSLFSVFMKL